MRLEHIDEMYRLTCERSHHPHILNLFLVKRHWLLGVVRPAVPVGQLMVLSYRRSTGIATVRKELHSFLCNKRINHHLNADFGHPIVSWQPFPIYLLRK